MSSINIENLTFAYPGSYDNIFEDVNIQMDTDWKLGFVGRNGRGKTTLLQLLQGKYPYSGRISSSVPFSYFPYPVQDMGLPAEEVLQQVCPLAEEWELLRELSRLELEEEVRFLGFVTDVAPLLSVLDLQLNASYGTETSSLSILEGMSMGLPAVVSDYGGNPWLIDDGEDGLLFPTRDASALARAGARLMDDRGELSRMGERAAEIFRQRFTGEIFAQNIENVYLDTLKGAK